MVDEQLMPLGLRPLPRDPAGESVDVDDPAAVDAPGDRLDAVVGLDLEGHDRAVHVDHPARQVTGEPFGGRRQVLDLDECPDAPLVLFQAGGDRIPRGILEMRDRARASPGPPASARRRS